MRSSSGVAKPQGTAPASSAPGRTAPAYLAAPHARVGTIIPRDVVVWLQSLSLSRPVKVPRRDLANGFAIAEICSRYWPSLVSMHSYENLLSTANKTSNWSLLQKVFAKQGAPLSDAVVHGVMSGKEHYADVFLTQLFSLLTGKTVQLTALPLDDLPEPVTFTEAFEPTSVALAGADNSSLSTRASPDNKKNGAEITLRNTYSYPTHALDGAGEQSTTAASAKATRVTAAARTAADALEALSSTTGTSRSRGPVVVDTANERGDVTSSVTVSRPMAALAGPAALRAHRETSVGGNVDGAAPGHFLVDVKVRAATKSTTVVDPSSAQARGMPLGRVTTTTTTTTGAAGSGDHHNADGRAPASSHRGSTTTAVSMVPATAAIDLVEHLVRQAAERLQTAWEVNPRGSCPFATYFIQHESTLEARESSSIWSALLSALHELVPLLRDDSTLLASLTVLFLGVRPTMMGFEKGTTTTTTTLAAKPSPRAVSFMAAVFVQLASLDPHHTLALFQSGVLAVPAMQQWLLHMQFSEVEGLATLFCAALSPDRPTAALLLPDLLSSVYETIVDHAEKGVESVGVFYMLLRAVATRLVRLIHGTRASVSGRPSTGLAPLRGSADKDDPLNSALLHILDFNTVTALTSSAATVRLVGAALATTAARLGLTMTTVLATHTRLLFPTLDLTTVRAQSWQWLLPLTDAPALHVVRAQWLRTVQERLAAMEDDATSEGLGGSVDTEGTQPVALRVKNEVIPRLFTALCEYVAAPGGHLKAKALVAYELACALVALPASFSPTSSLSSSTDDVRDAVAETVITFFATRAPADVVAATLGVNNSLLPSREPARTTGVDPALALEEALRSGIVWQHTLLGPMRVQQLAVRSAPLFLCGAVSSMAMRTSTTVESRKEAVRRLTARAAALAKEGDLADSARLRIEWLHALTVGYSGGSASQPAPRALPMTARQLSRSDVEKRWERVLQEAYVDFLLVLSAEELIVRQRQGAVVAGAPSSTQTSASPTRPLSPMQEALLVLAEHVRGVLRQWFTDLSSALGSGTVARDDDLDANAITWYHTTFGDVEES